MARVVVFFFFFYLFSFIELQSSSLDGNLFKSTHLNSPPLSPFTHSSNRGDDARVLVLQATYMRVYSTDPDAVTRALVDPVLPTNDTLTQLEFSSAVTKGDVFLMNMLLTCMFALVVVVRMIMTSPLSSAIVAKFPIDLNVLVNKQPLIFVALYTGQRKSFQALVNLGANLDVRSTDNITLVEAAAERGCDWALELLYRRGITTNVDAALHRAAALAQTSVAAVIEQLLRMGASLTHEIEGMMAIHAAAIHGSVEAMNALLTAGAAPNTLTKMKISPLFFAALQGHTKVVQALLEHGADAALANEEGWTPLFIAAHEGHIEVWYYYFCCCFINVLSSRWLNH